MTENGIKKIVVGYHHCEMDNCREVRFSEDAWRLMRNTFEAAGIEVVEERLPDPFTFSNAHKVRELFHAMHEVQGLKWEEGCSMIPALESLINEYIKLK